MSFVTILKHSPKHMSAAAALRRGARLRRARGAEVLEAALVLSLIVFPLVCGMVEYGYYFHLQHTLTSASREGARAGINVGATNADVTTAVNRVLNTVGLKPADYTTDIALDTGTNILTVTVKGQWSKVGISPMPIIGVKKQFVTGRASMKVEPSLTSP